MKLTTCVGAPIDVGKAREPTDVEVRKIHSAYCTALTKVFDDNKKRLGYAEANLEII